MSIQYTARLRSGFAEFTCHGTYGKEELLDLFETALDYAAEHGLHAVLVDVSDVEGDPDQTERFELGARFADTQLSKETIVAIAVKGNEPLVHPERFAETVALDRCAVGKVFTDMEEAVHWLEHTSG